MGKCSYVLILLLISNSIFAQQVELKGKVLDEQTKTALPYAHVIHCGSNLGTVSNADGLFILKLNHPQATDSIEISYMGYRHLKVSYRDLLEDVPELYLKAISVNLNELTITDESPQEIVAKAFAKVGENYPTEDLFFQGFFREIILQDTACLAFSEALVHIHKKNYIDGKSDDEIQLVKGRSKVDPKESVLLKHVNFRGGLLGSVRLDVLKTQLFDEKSQAYFAYELDDFTQLQGKWMYVIKFDRHPDSKKAGLKGRFFIEVESYAFARIEMERNEIGLKQDNKFGLKNELAMKRLGLKLEKLSRTFVIDYRLLADKWQLFTTQYQLKMRVIQKKEPSLIHYQTKLFMYDLLEEGSYLKQQKNISKRNMAYREVSKYEDEAFWQNFQYVQPAQAEAQLMQKLILKAEKTK